MSQALLLMMDEYLDHLGWGKFGQLGWSDVTSNPKALVFFLDGKHPELTLAVYWKQTCFQSVFANCAAHSHIP